MRTFEEAIEFIVTMRDRDRDRVVKAFVPEARENIHIMSMLDSLCRNMGEMVSEDTDNEDLVYSVVQSGMFTALMHGIAIGREMERQDRLPHGTTGGGCEETRADRPESLN